MIYFLFSQLGSDPMAPETVGSGTVIETFTSSALIFGFI